MQYTLAPNRIKYLRFSSSKNDISCIQIVENCFWKPRFSPAFGEATQEKRYKTIYGSSWFLQDETQINSGEGGIRTLGTRERTHAFQACSLSHSDTSPSIFL
ncbi:uncharacterized protein METZ01_LOCUS56376 [marine metagenome]|uniref:Uncharacterized protein n=1 Tax=marine metagenome TaxID=408172 RepID=A0A381SHF6_9ZZZZ